MYKCIAAAAKSACPTLCDPIGSSPPGSPIPGILQARILEWVAISFSNAWKWRMKVKFLSHVRLLATQWTAAYQAPPSMWFSRQEYVWANVKIPKKYKIYSSDKQEQELQISWVKKELDEADRGLGDWTLWCENIQLYNHLYKAHHGHAEVQFNSIAQSCPTLCDPMDCSMPGFPVHHQLPELAQTLVHRVGDAIQPSHPLSSPSPPAFNFSHH